MAPCTNHNASRSFGFRALSVSLNRTRPWQYSLLLSTREPSDRFFLMVGPPCPLRYLDRWIDQDDRPARMKRLPPNQIVADLYPNQSRVCFSFKRSSNTRAIRELRTGGGKGGAGAPAVRSTAGTAEKRKSPSIRPLTVTTAGFLLMRQ